MKTAVLISGQTRTFAQCLKNLNWTVFRRLENPTFFVSVADDAQANDAYLLEGYWKDVHIERVVQPTLPEPPFSACLGAPYAPTPNNQAVVQSILRQLWAYKRVWEFMGEKSNDVFTHYVRCRPDLHFHRFEMPLFHGINCPRDTDFCGPWKATCGGVNDRFSVMGRTAARAYFNALDALPELLKDGCPLHPESIQQAALERAGCTISNTLLAEFTCIRLQGAHVPLVEYPGELAAYLKAIQRH
jgi:hypothetical protein